MTDTDMRFLMSLNLSDPKDRENYCAWLKAQHGIRTAGARGALRTNVQFHEDTMTDFSAPDPYARDIARLRAASATADTTFEDGWKADRLSALDAEHAKIDAYVPASPQPRLTAAEAVEYDPPEPYKAGLDKMRSEGR